MTPAQLLLSCGVGQMLLKGTLIFHAAGELVVVKTLLSAHRVPNIPFSALLCWWTRGKNQETVSDLI